MPKLNFKDVLLNAGKDAVKHHPAAMALDALDRATEGFQGLATGMGETLHGKEGEPLKKAWKGLTKKKEFTGKDILKGILNIPEETFQGSKEQHTKDMATKTPWEMATYGPYTSLDPMQAASAAAEVVVDPFTVGAAAIKGVSSLKKFKKGFGLLKKADKVDDNLEAFKAVRNTITTPKKKSFNLIETAKRAEAELLDEAAPVKRFERLSKKPLIPEDSPYTTMRLSRGIAGHMDETINDTIKTLKSYKLDNVDDLKVFLRSKRDLEIKRLKGDKFGTSLTREQAEGAIKHLQGKYGENFKNIEGAAGTIKDLNQRAMARRVESGLISDKTAQTLLKEHPDYVPTEVIEKIEQGYGKYISSARHTPIKEAGKIKTLTGRKLGAETIDPIETSIRNYYGAEVAAQQNDTTGKMIKLLRDDPETFQGLIKPLKLGEKTEQGFGKIRHFVDGRELEFAVPEPIARAMSSMDKAQMDILSSLMGKSGRAFRAGVTTMNPFFIVPNFMRDVTTAFFTEKVGPISLGRGISASLGLTKEGRAAKKLFKMKGGAFGGLSGQARQIGHMEKMVDKATMNKWDKFIKTVSPKEFFGGKALVKAPINAIEKVGETIENVPRLATFIKVQRQGKSATEAAMRARDATVDFAKMGSTMRIINAWVPFFNARLQGSINLLRAAKNKPAHAATAAVLLGAVPEVMTYVYNKKMLGDAYNDLPEYLLDNYTYIATGTTKNDRGEVVPTGIKLPKSDVERVVGNTVRSVIESYQKEYPTEWKKIVLNVLSNISPADFERDGDLAPDKLLGSLLPPPIKALAESLPEGGYSFFKGQQLEKNMYEGIPREKLPPRDRYDPEYTSPPAEYIGKKMNWSPTKIDNAWRNMTGEVGAVLANPKTFSKRGIGRFYTEQGGERERKEVKKMKEFEQEFNSKYTLPANREAGEIFKSLPAEQDFKSKLQREIKGEMAADKLEMQGKKLPQKRLKSLMKRDSANREYPETVLKNMSPDAKVAYLTKEIEGKSLKEIIKYLEDLIDKDVVSSTIEEEVMDKYFFTKIKGQKKTFKKQ